MLVNKLQRDENLKAKRCTTSDKGATKQGRRRWNMETEIKPHKLQHRVQTFANINNVRSNTPSFSTQVDVSALEAVTIFCNVCLKKSMTLIRCDFARRVAYLSPTDVEFRLYIQNIFNILHLYNKSGCAWRACDCVCVCV
jgi:hypothetical protein